MVSSTWDMRNGEPAWAAPNIWHHQTSRSHALECDANDDRSPNGQRSKHSPSSCTEVILGSSLGTSVATSGKSGVVCIICVPKSSTLQPQHNLHKPDTDGRWQDREQPSWSVGGGLGGLPPTSGALALAVLSSRNPLPLVSHIGGSDLRSEVISSQGSSRCPVYSEPLMSLFGYIKFQSFVVFKTFITI